MIIRLFYRWKWLDPVVQRLLSASALLFSGFALGYIYAAVSWYQ